VGLPVGPRRRASGLRREEVAVLAGLSPTWYTYLEQGRDIRPSMEVLDSLARVLGLTEDEQRYMHTLAGSEVGKTLPLASDLPAEEIVRQLVLTTESSEHPVYAVDVYCEMVAWNTAAASYYTDFGRFPKGRRNMLRWLLEDPEARERLPEWREEVRDITARWRAQLAPHKRTERLAKLIDEFTSLSDDFERWWNAYDVQEHRSRPRQIRHPELGDRYLRLVVVQAPDFAPCVVVFHVPT
jgi:transcriptional regulator with XRE-family HTH domain